MQASLKLKAKLEEKGYRVVLTRTESDRESLGVTQSLTNRVKLANDLNADFFVSIHHNSAGSQSANGVETYYSTKVQDSSFGGKNKTLSIMQYLYDQSNIYLDRKYEKFIILKNMK